MAFTEDDIKKVAKAAVEETLLLIGVDVSKPESVTEMQADFKHVRMFRRSMETVQRQTIISAIAICVSGIAGAIYMALGRAH